MNQRAVLTQKPRRLFMSSCLKLSHKKRLFLRCIAFIYYDTDYVYVLNQGKVVAEGTFEALKATNPIFQELWKHQEVEGGNVK